MRRFCPVKPGPAPACALIAALLLASAGAARGQALWLAGGEAAASDSSYLYLGRLASVQHDSLQNGLAWRLWADQVRYGYDSGGQRIQGRAWGLEAGLGWLWGDSASGGSAFASVVGRDTRLRPQDPGNAAQGFHTSLKLQADLRHDLSPRWQAQLGASYTVLNDAYWARLRLLYRPGSDWRIGLEHVRAGDQSYGLRQTGLVLSDLRWGAAGVHLKLGARQLRGEGAKPYVGIELGWMY